MARLHFVIRAEPIAQGRPRLTTIGGMARAFDPKKSRDWKAYVAHLATDAMEDAGLSTPMDGPLSVRIRFGFSLPKSQWRKRTPRPRQWHAKRPDIDNLYKGVIDAMEGIVFHRDSEISQVMAQKVIVAQGDGPFVSILVEKLSADAPN